MGGQLRIGRWGMLEPLLSMSDDSDCGHQPESGGRLCPRTLSTSVTSGLTCSSASGEAKQLPVSPFPLNDCLDLPGRVPGLGRGLFEGELVRHNPKSG
mmetsp:Transcript_79427/g.157384  ORF Transcript_79427/g.157384 Transcript_79427/m.157384 type:complete len:98 (-) Transcript_79427:316-609(-)